ncbi:MAG: TetR family transcriptional regulator [Candidatus Dactylopiibacterium carminicum]|uniref:TetR family transcriptional regulator n=1 Tax=Candidatus Dactylopiibacterium carminicum TaxID=857335 RepID=A0A272EVW5_9RHOO|nr:TetR/AcrR family transcriptional regulator [Candidatus Dactylopiibacterium carminicum]KAF7599610.1 TetR family transcriptional regulator [Candidatus Dactylopiibacterium carminicum]PAS94257.1 MAG: TetR family transcriptional regulator [Candidatus Dactylopiibacterium carminicum]PAS98453.1 MAG: TetR family transcriptional regulator [Candidatus Dactylopiibacterium carminicum]PAS99613.1 MAG: TetR family transcriptional regulator [Candidatus Dactylopiibacterium carminicum]
MEVDAPVPRRRGRPPKSREQSVDARELLLRAGLEVLTEKGFSISGIDEILKRAGVPKGSFYHYFASKEAFGHALIERYAGYFARKLEKHFGDESRTPLVRIQDVIADLQAGMARHQFRRGCLVGNLGQEMGGLPESFRAQLDEVFLDWQQRLARCLRAAQQAGEIPAGRDCDALAAFFWIGWEGAVLRAKLTRNPEPLRLFSRFFLAGLATP